MNTLTTLNSFIRGRTYTLTPNSSHEDLHSTTKSLLFKQDILNLITISNIKHKIVKDNVVKRKIINTIHRVEINKELFMTLDDDMDFYGRGENKLSLINTNDIGVIRGKH